MKKADEKQREQETLILPERLGKMNFVIIIRLITGE